MREWLPVYEVAEMIGVTAPAIYARIKGERFPALPMQLVAGQKSVRPYEAFQHFRSHGRTPPGLKAPAGYAPADAAPALQTSVDPGKRLVDPDIIRAIGDSDPLEMDPHELTWQLAVAGIDKDKVRTFVQAARELRGKRDSAARTGKNLPPDDVVIMLRQHVALFVDEIQAGESRLADAILTLVRQQFGIDLAEKHTGAHGMLLNVIGEQLGNGVIAALRRTADEQRRGIQPLEFTP